MLDKENQHIFDKTFVNNSWKSLKGRLDVEIPTPTKKINKVILGLSALLLLFAVSTGYLLFNKYNTIPTAQLTKEVVTYQKVYVEVPKIVEKEIIRYVPNSYQLNNFIVPTAHQNNSSTTPIKVIKTDNQELSLSNQKHQTAFVSDVSEINQISQTELNKDQNFLNLPFKGSNIKPFEKPATLDSKISFCNAIRE